MTIRLAVIEKLDEIMTFYHELIEAMKEVPTFPKWQKDFYPTEKEIQEFIIQNNFYIATESDEIIGAFALTHEQMEGYKNIKWKAIAEGSEITVIHLLAVSHKYHKKGIGKSLVEYIINYCRDNNQKSIRLDVLINNTPAMNLYQSCGFEYRGDTQLYYEDCGTLDFKLYEYMI